MLKVRKGGGEETHLIQGNEQWLRFAGAAVQRYPMPKGRESQDGRCCTRASEGKHTEIILKEN